MTPFQSFFFFFFFFIFLNMGDRVASQTLSDTTEGGSIPPQDSSLRNNFQPSLAVVIGMLAVMFSLTFVLLLYAKFCHRASSVHHHTATSRHQIQDGLARSSPGGLDKTVVSSLPFFRFSSLRGSKQGLECSVCLARFRDVEVLRLLPKCKHAFHMDCIDRWLEKHATCPLCRHKVSPDDLILPESGSWRKLVNGEGSNRLELYVEREDSRRWQGGSSIGRSFRKLFDKEEEEEDEILPIQRMSDDDDQVHHKFKHRITVVSDVMLKNRWSDLNSSDLMFLNSELLGDVSSARFEPAVEAEKASSSWVDEKRSMSEIILHPRSIGGDQVSNYNNNKEEKVRKVWLPMAKKTAHWFANRESRPPQPQS